MRRHFIVSYDISDPTRLRRVHKIVRDFGDPLQLSVFSCILSAKDLAVLEARLRRVMNDAEDQVLLVDLGPRAKTNDVVPGCRTLGRAIPFDPAATVIF